jgi:hypothetical protein
MPRLEKLERVIHSGGMTDRLNSPASCPTGLIPGTPYPKGWRPGGTPLHRENQFVHSVHNVHSVHSVHNPHPKAPCRGAIPKPRVSEAQPWDPPHSPQSRALQGHNQNKPNKSSLNKAPTARPYTSLGRRPRIPPPTMEKIETGNPFRRNDRRLNSPASCPTGLMPGI